MNKTLQTLLISLVSLVLIVIIVWTIVTPPRGKKAVERAYRGTSFAQFVRDGGSYRCNVASGATEEETLDGEDLEDDLAFEAEGSVFVKDNKVRGLFQSDINGQSVNIEILMRDGTSYTWVPNSLVGIKTVFTDSEDQLVQQSAAATYVFNLEEIGQYECFEEEVADEIFEIPQNLTFQEIF
jgi:hypothetical protein